MNMTTTTQIKTIPVFATETSVIDRPMAERLRHLVDVGIQTLIGDVQSFADAADKGSPEARDVMLGMRREFERYVAEGRELLTFLDCHVDATLAAVVLSRDEVDILTEAHAYVMEEQD